MKTRLLAAGRHLWQFLTVIPGWPDAGKVARTFYVLPLAVPFLALLLLYGWARLRHDPEVRAVRVASEPALQLEAEIATLRGEWSESQSAESAAATAKARQGLVQSAADLDAQLAAMGAAAVAQGWAATLRASDVASEAPAAGNPIAFRTVRGRLEPLPENQACFASLLTLLDRLVPEEKCGGITRLAVRADEQGKLAVELGVRFAASPTDEKTP